ncbi:MAG: DUF3987 domain-containing protein [Alloprevotella sp.]|nr:DUF3987 domain-containing protein [Alloprevotella sp.]
MLTFDYCESVGALPRRLENTSQLLGLFQRKSVAETVAALRATQDKEERARLKKRLPAVCWQATFGGQKRANANAIPSGLFMLDIDHVEDVMTMWKEQIQPLLAQERIALVHISPSGKGLRVVARCGDAAPIALQQERLAEALGVPFDAVCKDMARLSFVSRSDEILHLNSEMFDEEGMQMPEKESAQLKSLHTAARDEQPAAENCPRAQAPVYRDVNLQDFVEAWMAARGGVPEEGVRNHTFYALGRDLRYLCNFSASTMARCVSDGMLNGFPRAELLQVFESACQSTRRGTYPPAVEQILGTLQGEVDTVEGFDPRTVEKLPPMPYAIEEFVKLAPEDFKAPTVVACLPVLGTICTHVRARYLDGELHSPSFMTVIEAEQASGKSFTRRIVDVLMKPLREADIVAREEEKAYLQRMKLSRNKQEQPEDPKAKVRIIPASVSVAKLLQRMDYAEGEHLFSFCEEIDTLYKSNKSGAWAQKSDLYRNAFDNAEYGQDYMSDNSYSTIVKVYYNLLLCGTPKAVSRFFPDVEDGLVSRVIFSRLPSQFGAQFPEFRTMHRSVLEKLQRDMRLELGRKEEILDCGFLNRRLAAWLEAKRVESLKTLNKAEDQFRRRAAVIGFRAGMLAWYLGGAKRTHASRALATGFALWCANYVLSEQLRRFADTVNSEVEISTHAPRCVQVYDVLPAIFSRNELVTTLKRLGYRTSPRHVIYAWKKEGLIEKTSRDTLRKTANKPADAEPENNGEPDNDAEPENQQT